MKHYTGKRWLVVMRVHTPLSVNESIRLLLQPYCSDISAPVCSEGRWSFEVIVWDEVTPLVWVQNLCGHWVESVAMAPELLKRSKRMGRKSK